MLRWIAWSVAAAAGLIVMLAIAVIVYLHIALKSDEAYTDRSGLRTATHYMTEVDARLKSPGATDAAFIPTRPIVTLVSVQHSGTTTEARILVYADTRSQIAGPAVAVRCFVVRFGSTSQPRITLLRPCPTTRDWVPTVRPSLNSSLSSVLADTKAS